MSEETALTEDEIHQIVFNLERGQMEPWQVRKLITTIRTQRRVLKHLFDLFRDIDAYGLRAQSDSIRSHNLNALKRTVGMEDSQ